MNKKLYWLGFSVFPGVGAKKFGMLVKKFESAEHAWKADKEDLENVLGDILVEKFLLFRKNFDLEQYSENLVKKNIRIITLLDEEYPSLLKNLSLYDPPFLLYCKGDLSLLSSQQIIAVVGTRKITRYGQEVTKLLTSQLVQNNFTIVSGLALGVDATAHMTTIENNGKTIAVLGCGVDCCTPASNQYAYDAILDSGGAIISAFPPGMQATKGSFPARNAVIAGMSQGVLVTEGAEDSGALITAQRAKEFGRPIFAVPGPITSSYSKGVNRLLGNGAVAVTRAKDILKVLGRGEIGFPLPLAGEGLRVRGNTREEQEILNMLQLGSMHFDEIVRKIDKDAKSVGSLLSLMEVKGMIKNNNSMYSV